jgi:hypothetical protein
MPGTGARGVDGLDFMSRIDVSLKNGSETGHSLKWKGQRMNMR